MLYHHGFVGAALKVHSSHLRVDPALAGYFTVSVRVLFTTLPLVAWLMIGCAAHRGGAPSFTETSPDHVIMTPDTLLVGKIAKVNIEGGFVVLTFPIGHLPLMDQRLNVYRRGLKVGEVRVTGPQLDDSVVGDISAGDAQAGDTVRSQ